MQLETAERTALATALLARLDGASSYAYMTVCDDTTVIVTFTLPKPSLSIANGVMSLLGGPYSDTAVASGTIDRVKFYDSDDTLRMTAGAGETGSGKDFIFTNCTVNSGQTVGITSGTITVPAGSI